VPLPMKSLKEVAAELGMPEAEIRVLVHSQKIRAVMKKGVLSVPPDEIARMKRLRKTSQDSARTAEPAAPPKPAPGKVAPSTQRLPPKPPIKGTNR
jgi:hypothetical protein